MFIYNGYFVLETVKFIKVTFDDRVSFEPHRFRLADWLE